MAGGFHPWHGGHTALYQAARQTFPDAEVFVAATDDTSTRPFPFAVKEKLAQLAGVEPGHFVRVKSPFRAQEITSQFDPEQDQLIFVRSEKDAGSQPQPGGVKLAGSPSYLQPYSPDQELKPFGQHAYMAYLPTVEFGPGLTSATQIRTAWPTLNDKRKTALVMSLYPRTQGNARLAATVVQLLDAAIMDTVAENQGWAATLETGDGPVEAWGYVYDRRDQRVAWRKTFPTLADAQRWARSKNATMLGHTPAKPVAERAENSKEYTRDPELYRLRNFAKQHYSQYTDDADMAIMKWLQRGLYHSEENDIKHEKRLAALAREIQNIKNQLRQQQPDFLDEKWSRKYKRSIDCSNPKGFSQRAHCAGRKK